MKISVGRWPEGFSVSDEEYAKVAYLYTEALNTAGKNTNMVLAMTMQVPISTVRERIRRCRELGLITMPGKGKRGVLTLKACYLLKGEN